jgi:hypothetical protein
MAISGCSDKIQILKETTYADGGLAGEKVFGVTKRFEWKTETSTQQSYGLETDGPQATVNTDGVLLVSGTHEWELTNGREFEAILGAIVEGGGTFSLDVNKTLPSYSAKVVDDSGSFNLISGIKYSKFTLDLARGEDPIKITAEWIGKQIENTGSFTPTVTTVEPLMYLDGYFEIDSTKQIEVEDFSLEIDRACQGRRFIENTATGSRRLINSIIEGPLALAYSGNMGAQREVLEEIWGGGSMQDTRSDKTIVLNISRGSMGLTLTLSGGRHISSGRILEKEQEVSLMDFAGLGLDISGTGTYAV